MARLAVIDLNPVELNYYLFIIRLDECYRSNNVGDLGNLFFILWFTDFFYLKSNTGRQSGNKNEIYFSNFVCRFYISDVGATSAWKKVKFNFSSTYSFTVPKPQQHNQLKLLFSLYINVNIMIFFLICFAFLTKIFIGNKYQ